MITINNKEYDEEKLSDDAKLAYINIKNLQKDNGNLSLKMNNNNILLQHYSAILEKELPKED